MRQESAMEHGVSASSGRDSDVDRQSGDAQLTGDNNMCSDVRGSDAHVRTSNDENMARLSVSGKENSNCPAKNHSQDNRPKSTSLWRRLTGRKK
jgi:hypothetical protein